MYFRNIRKQKAGKVIKASTLATTAATAEWAAKLRAAAPLEISSTIAGPLIRLAGMLFSVYLVKTTGTITARSGTTPGSGPVDLYTFDGTSLVALGVARTVLNYSGATGGIPSGTYGVVLKITSRHWFISAECV